MASLRQHDSPAAWASALAARIRLIHAGFVDESAEQRRAFVADEIERAVAEVPPSSKRQYLTCLAEHFPDWQPTAGGRAGDAEVTLAPGQLLDQLLSRLGELNPAERERLVERVRQEGLVKAEPVAGGHHLELWKKYAVDAAREPSPERVWRLASVLIDFFTALDQLAWTLWRNMGTKSAFWRENEVAKLVGPYLAGDHEVSSDQMRQTIERTRRLIAAILGAPGRAASDVASRQAENLSPEAIELAARSGKRALESLDAACWREYKQRHAATGTAPHVEAAIQAAVAQAAEDLIGGRTR